MPMNFSTRFKLLLAAVLVSGAVVSWPFLRRMGAMRKCYDSGNSWNVSTHQCEAPINPHPVGSDSTTRPQAKPLIVPAH